jgi:ferredoxin-NADP reductase
LGGLTPVSQRAPGRWQIATVASIREETPRVKSFTFDLPMWMPHLPGQHYDVRLTAEDGYQAQRSYSVASSPLEEGRVELTIDRLADGEVSPYFHDVVQEGDQVELRGPFASYFVWHGESPVLLVGGGSGVVPLMAMLRHREATGNTVDARLLLSARTIEDVFYRDELDGLAAGSADVSITLTRGDPPPGWQGFARRIDRDMLVAVGPPPGERPLVYVCGPTPFVEEAARLLVELGHEPARVHTERFGPTGG